jgi:hypothetical protein
MYKVILLLTVFLFFSCSTDGKQIETLRDRAKTDIITQLQLPEGTAFNDEHIEIRKDESDVAGIDAVFTVLVTVKSQDRDGKEINKTYTLEYEKVGEGGLDPKDYELKSFN